MKLLKNKDDKFSIIKILSIAGLLLAIIVSSFNIYDRFIQNDVLTIEQRLTPDMMKALKDGETIHIEKGISLDRSGE